MTPNEQNQLQRFRDLLRGALHTVVLSANELYLIWDAVQDTIIDASTARQLVHDLITSVRLRRLDEVYDVDMSQLCRKLTSYTDLQRMAILDALEQAEILMSHMSMKEGLVAVRLLSDSSDEHDTSQVASITAWIRQVNSLDDLNEREQARPPVPFLMVSGATTSYTLIGWAGGWAFWDIKQPYWIEADWLRLSQLYPLLPSQVVQAAELTSGFHAEQITHYLETQGCQVIHPKAKYQLDDEITVVARWDGEASWWFDLPYNSELVLTVEESSGILWVEMRAQLGMGTRHRWQHGLFTMRDLRAI